MQHVICYVSTASSELNTSKIEELLEKWQEWNSEKDIKGVLLYSDGHFFQVLEGEKARVLELFVKIKNDPRHNDIIQVVGKDVEKGSLNGYMVDNLHNQRFSKPELIQTYLEAVKGMESQVQQQIKVIMGSFIDTQLL
ncbi:BLUF domain-containing protein [Salinimicrobium soli]|uniref:BLUF domain-containing protein n=1 Tax=Salinimicrobium soli TaxID=1254399 RepID=UPI003AAC1E43